MSSEKEGRNMTSAHDAHRPTEKEIEALYARAARETEDEWVRQLVGVDRPVSEREAEQALEGLFARWTGRPETHGPAEE